MSVPITTIYLQSFTWNSLTFNAGSGGPIRGEFMHEGEELPDRTSDADYATFLAIVNKHGRMRLTVREIKQVMALGSKSNAVMTCTGKANSVAITGTGMVLVRASPGEQGRAQAGSCSLEFAYESVDGATAPFA